MGKQEPDPKSLDDSNSTHKPDTSTLDVLAATDMAKPSISSSLLPQPSWFTAKRWLFPLPICVLKMNFVFLPTGFPRILNFYFFLPTGCLLNFNVSWNCNYKVWFAFLGHYNRWNWLRLQETKFKNDLRWLSWWSYLMGSPNWINILFIYMELLSFARKVSIPILLYLISYTSWSSQFFMHSSDFVFCTDMSNLQLPTPKSSQLWPFSHFAPLWLETLKILVETRNPLVRGYVY